ncbi:MAG: hypothetical protein ACLTXL_06730 [Clostridia bacterium]
MSNHGGNSAAIPDIGNGILSYSAVQFDPISANTLEEVDQNADRILQWMDRAVVGTLDAISSYFRCCFSGIAPVNWLQLELPSIVPIKSLQMRNFRCESSIHGSSQRMAPTLKTQPSSSMTRAKSRLNTSK